MKEPPTRNLIQAHVTKKIKSRSNESMLHLYDFNQMIVVYDFNHMIVVYDFNQMIVLRFGRCFANPRDSSKSCLTR
jgi:hypothetical protein